MVKILLKALVLFLIVLSVYFIVHPQACSNFLAGRETVFPAEEGTVGEWRHPMAEPQQSITDKSKDDWQTRDELFTSQEKPAKEQAKEEAKEPAKEETLKAIQPSYSQEDMDYAMASRYVELEREYAKTHPMGKDTASELSYIVMEEFHITPTEWNSFLARATASNLFEKARQDLPADTTVASTNTAPAAVANTAPASAN